MGLLVLLNWSMWLIVYLLFYSELLFYSLWPAAVQTFKKHQYAPTRTHKKSYIILHRFSDENTLVCYPFSLFFLKGRIKFPKYWVGEEMFSRKSVRETKMGWDFFIFIFLFLAIMVTDTAFRKHILGKRFFEKIVPGTYKHWPYHTSLLVFCVKFRLSPVCEYLNYYYNITNDC